MCDYHVPSIYVDTGLDKVPDHLTKSLVKRDALGKARVAHFSHKLLSLLLSK